MIYATNADGTDQIIEAKGEATARTSGLGRTAETRATAAFGERAGALRARARRDSGRSASSRSSSRDASRRLRGDGGAPTSSSAALRRSSCRRARGRPRAAVGPLRRAASRRERPTPAAATCFGTQRKSRPSERSSSASVSSGESVTFMSPPRPLVAVTTPKGHAKESRWCGGAYGRLSRSSRRPATRHWGLQDPRSAPVGFAWIEPGVEQYVVVEHTGTPRSTLRWRLTDPTSRRPESTPRTPARPSRFSEHDSDGGRIRELRARRPVAG